MGESMSSGLGKERKRLGILEKHKNKTKSLLFPQTQGNPSKLGKGLTLWQPRGLEHSANRSPGAMEPWRQMCSWRNEAQRS